MESTRAVGKQPAHQHLDADINHHHLTASDTDRRASLAGPGEGGTWGRTATTAPPESLTFKHDVGLGETCVA